MTDVQQAVPVAQEDREAAADLIELIAPKMSWAEPWLLSAETWRRGHRGRADCMMVPEAFARHRLASLPCKSDEGAGEVPDGWTLEQGRPAATAPYACHVLGGRLDETAGEWVMAVVSTPLTAPFTHWWPLPGMTIAPDATQTREAEDTVPVRRRTDQELIDECDWTSPSGMGQILRWAGQNGILNRDHMSAALNARGGA